ncbi:hypothetical protein SISNIDRAFT_448741 [Sistotremastrum niveocremeum HHB9708]|uniref:Uncharacterized protein n=2 Tax=Sistotremastraceae TaxID=3402574 RepID=A0A165A545_9AGAM|nr:hypothetical protein SISNIDRAFT_448741 [Sistotremastrum niveocremeum HHB9708]KZT43578.1 hypothetical protein SISSUDRAFT_1040023 [Sistotremastrum suecicum HHB10207 ss-3]
MNQAERRVLWHPQAETRFIVGDQSGGQITLYDWSPEQSQIKHVNSFGGLQYLKCFAWCPSGISSDIIAVGTSTKVELMRLRSDALVKNSLQSPSSIGLPVRTQRACNSLSFCSASPNLLAAGLDKVRGEPSLLIWDVEAMSTVLSIATESLDNLDSHAHSQRHNPSSKPEARLVNSTAATDNVTATTFLSHSTNLLAAGVSHRWLRLFDIRNPTSAANIHSVASKTINGIATDPFERHRIACYGDGIISVWDTRSLVQPLLKFNDMDARGDGASRNTGTQFNCLEFSSSRRGVLASLERNANYVRFWDLMPIKVTEPYESGVSRERPKGEIQSTLAAKLSWAAPANILPWASNPDTTRLSLSDQDSLSYQLVLANTRTGSRSSSPISSFAFVPNMNAQSSTPNLLTILKNGDLEMYGVSDPSHTQWSCHGDLAVGSASTYSVYHPADTQHESYPDPWTLVNPSQSGDARSRFAVPESEGKLSQSPKFGRGDRDGFPLPSTRTKETSATRHDGPGNVVFEREPSNGMTLPEVGLGEQPSGRGNSSSRMGTGTEKPNRSSSRGRSKTYPEERTGFRALQDDVSLLMKRRALRGYGLQSPYNPVAARDDPMHGKALSEIWRWLNYSGEITDKHMSNQSGYDFTFQGVQTIWEGFTPTTNFNALSQSLTPRNAAHLELENNYPDGSSLSPSVSRAKVRKSRSPAPIGPHGSYVAAVTSLASRKDPERWSSRSTVLTAKANQRKLALQLCGFGESDDDLAAITRWDQEGKRRKAACWAVFSGQTKMALDLLTKSNDERDRLVAGMLAVFSETGGSNLMDKTPHLKEQYSRIIPALEDPYLRAMLYHLALEDWSEVLDEELLPLRERVALAIKFLSDSDLSEYLRRQTEQAKKRGDILGLILTGLTPAGMDLLQSYVDLTGDVQTAAVMASLVFPMKVNDSRAERWIETYRTLLDYWKLFHHRCQFDIQRGQILRDGSTDRVRLMEAWKPQIVLHCNFCSKTLDSRTAADGSRNATDTACPHCGRTLPRCSVCLLPIGIHVDIVRDAKLAAGYPPHEIVDHALLFCQSCRHGGHARHIVEWFEGSDDGATRSHAVCAVADCPCHCLSEPVTS